MRASRAIRSLRLAPERGEAESPKARRVRGPAEKTDPATDGALRTIAYGAQLWCAR